MTSRSSISYLAAIGAMEERWRLTREVAEAARSLCYAQHGEPLDPEGFDPAAKPRDALQRAIGALEAHERQWPCRGAP